MKKEDLVEITLAMASLDKHYQSLTSYALASEKKRKKIDKAVAKLIKLIHHSDEYCVDQESAMFVINQLNEHKVDRFLRPNIYFMSDVSGGITEPSKEFNATTDQTDNDPNPKLNPKITSKLMIECRLEDEGNNLFDLAKKYHLNFEDMIDWIKKTEDQQGIKTAIFKGKILTLESLKDKPRGDVYYCAISRKLYLKYDTGRDCYIASPKF